MSGFFQRLFVNPDPEPGSESQESGAAAPAASPPAVTPPSSVVKEAKPFTVAELANLLPPEWVKLEGIDVSREVALDLETLRKTTAMGRPAVLLSEVYRACPEIFPRPVSSADDFEVRLTPGRVPAFPGTESAGKTLPVGAATPFRAMAQEPARNFFPAPVKIPSTVKPVERTSAVTVSAAPAVGRTPLAPLIADIPPKSPGSATPPMTAPSHPTPSTPVTGTTNPSLPTPFMPPSSQEPGAAPSTGTAASVDDDFGMDFRQLELRAVFGLASVLPAEAVFRLSTSLPGIKAACYVVGEAMVFQHTAGGAKLESTPKAFIHLSALARDLGIKDTRLLTLQTDGGLLAFFNEGAGCLAVLHEGRRFAPGVKERLVIILRELARSPGTSIP